MNSRKPSIGPVPASCRLDRSATKIFQGVSLAVAVLALAGCSGGSTPSPAGSAPGSSGSSVQSSAAPSTSSQLESDYQRVIATVLPSVVQITAGDSLGSGIV
ncbi:signal protein PDZ, partial [Kitasatospora sp. NPDC048540]